MGKGVAHSEMKLMSYVILRHFLYSESNNLLRGRPGFQVSKGS